MNTPDIAQDIARRFIESLHVLEREGERGLDPMLALFADTATISNAALDLSGEERRGREGVRAFWSDYARSLRGAATHFHAVTQGAGAVGLFWTTRMASADGHDADAPRYEGATLLRLDPAGTRIVAMRGYYDTRALTSVVQA